MHFLLGFLLGYYTRNRPLLAATLLGIALVCFIVVPAIALSGLALSVRRETALTPSTNTRPSTCWPRLQDSRNYTSQFEAQHPCPGPSLRSPD